MIKEICEEIDKTIVQRERNNSKLFELVINVIRDKKDLSPKFVGMCYDIHEADTDCGEDEKTAKELGLKTPEWFIEFLVNIKKDNIEFWRFG